jgi:predicted TIM-barrel fold metal-dependent hydrolase
MTTRTPASTTRASEVRAEVGHPIVDADGHFVEIGPLLNDEVIASVEEFGGAALRERFLASGMAPTDTSSVLANRANVKVQDEWRAMPSWWGWPARNVRDRATSHLPRLLDERLDEFGIDFTVLYPSMSLSYLDGIDAELASAVCRAVNRYHARLFAPYADRITVGALIPMQTPQHAVDELLYAVRELGMKSALIAGHARRPLPAAVLGGGTFPYRLDTYGIDSEFDYDMLWATCVELGIAPVSHSAVQYHRVTRSISNYVFNHIGGLSQSHEALAKSLFLGGVTRRFPELRIGFLEGGVAWACSLFADLVGHWEKRNADRISDLDPDNLDVDEMVRYLSEYGDDAVAANLDRLREYFGRPGARPAQVDEFAAAEIREPDDFRALFADRFYFGCEADDPLLTWAFRDDVNPLGARLRPVFGSDIAHWDVPDMTEPVAEAFELVERGLIGLGEFRELTFLNPVRLHAEMNPRFFEGTRVETAVADVVAANFEEG